VQFLHLDPDPTTQISADPDPKPCAKYIKNSTLSSA